MSPLRHSFSELLSEHVELEELFNEHQRALLARNLDMAFGTISKFEHLLKEHIGFEEQVLLPLYNAKRLQTLGGTVPIFQAEHRKLMQGIVKLARYTQALSESDDILGSILKLLDDEAMFKGLFHHHSLREKNLLFPRLDACTSEPERRKALGKHAA